MMAVIEPQLFISHLVDVLAIPMFWMSSNPTVQRTSMCELTGNRKQSKMAAAEPEVLRPQHLGAIATKFGRLCLRFLASCNPTVLRTSLRKQTEVENIPT